MVPKPTKKYSEKIHHTIYFEKGLEEPRKFVFNSSSIPVFLFSQQWPEVCIFWHFASVYDLIMLLVSSYDQII